MDKHERQLMNKLIDCLREAQKSEPDVFPEQLDEWQAAIDEAEAYMDSLHPSTISIIAYHEGKAGSYKEEIAEHIEQCKPCQRRLKAAAKLVRLCGGEIELY